MTNLMFLDLDSNFLNPQAYCIYLPLIKDNNSGMDLYYDPNPYPDSDVDGAPDVCDNCPNDYNPLQEDTDGDYVGNACDNCPSYPNGPNRGTYTEVIGINLIVSTGQFCTVDTECDPDEFCEKTQADNYPPGGNGIGDACDCEADFDCDIGGLDVDAFNVEQLLWDFGRSLFHYPCSNERFCFGDVNCDTDVDADDVMKFVEDFGRSQFNNPCPPCVEGPWCVYP